jgi:hypothetical protein
VLKLGFNVVENFKLRGKPLARPRGKPFPSSWPPGFAEALKSPTSVVPKPSPLSTGGPRRRPPELGDSILKKEGAADAMMYYDFAKELCKARELSE